MNDTAPTPHHPAPLQAVLDLLHAGHWVKAHDLVQRDASDLAAWLHGILHVQEGDLEDAEHWYGRAGRKFRERGTLAEELALFQSCLESLEMRTPHQIVSDHYAASARGDLAAMMAEVAPDVQWTEMAGFPCAGTHVGPQQVAEHVFKVLGCDWEGYRFELDTLLDAGPHVVGTGRYRGRHRATGKTLDARVAHVWEVRDGLVRRFEQFTDTLLVAQAMA